MKRIYNYKKYYHAVAKNARKSLFDLFVERKNPIIIYDALFLKFDEDMFLPLFLIGRLGYLDRHDLKYPHYKYWMSLPGSKKLLYSRKQLEFMFAHYFNFPGYKSKTKRGISFTDSDSGILISKENQEHFFKAQKVCLHDQLETMIKYACDNAITLDQFSTLAESDIQISKIQFDVEDKPYQSNIGNLEEVLSNESKLNLANNASNTENNSCIMASMSGVQEEIAQLTRLKYFKGGQSKVRVKKTFDHFQVRFPKFLKDSFKEQVSFRKWDGELFLWEVGLKHVHELSKWVYKANLVLEQRSVQNGL